MSTPKPPDIITRLLNERRLFARALDRYANGVLVYAAGATCPPSRSVVDLEADRLEFDAAYRRYVDALEQAVADRLAELQRTVHARSTPAVDAPSLDGVRITYEEIP